MPMNEADRNNIIEAMKPRLDIIIKNLGKCFELERREAANSYACYIEAFMDFVDGMKKESKNLNVR